MANRLFLALACALFLVRLPSLVEPMGADQGLYAQVGESIRAGGLPYRDAWDQKPPAIHFVYAGMRALWPRDSAVAAVDLLIAVVVAALLYALGGALAGRGTGQAAAVIFLFLSSPAFARLSGVSVRAQCETFVAALVTGALLLVTRSRHGAARAGMLAAGLLLGAAFTFKYNTAVYALVPLVALFLWKRLRLADAVTLAVGFAIPVAALLFVFARGGALRDLYAATILYNVRYSGETYAGPLDAIRYLLIFPVRHARVDALWLLGGAGCAVLLVAAVWRRERLVPVGWVASACLAIAINGSRDLPQYFIQAAPALALAAAWAGSILWTRWRVANVAALVLLAVAVWRVNDFPKLADNTWHDARYAVGRIDRGEHLARYGDRTRRKYSALAVAELGDYMRAHTQPADRVLVFGFSCGAYVEAGRLAASRFSWSRPVIVGFNDGTAGYGVGGLLADLQRTAPAIVALQIRDWAPDVDDSAHFFMSRPELTGWLRASYDQVQGPEGFDVWTRRGRQ